MEKIRIKTEIPVIVIVTEQFKQKLSYELQDKIRKLELELQQLDFTSRRTLMEAERQGQLAQVQKQVEAERQQRLANRQPLVEQLKVIARLQPGDEVLQGNVEGMMEIGVGDNWNMVRSAKIVIRDGQVVEIRHE